MSGGRENVEASFDVIRLLERIPPLAAVPLLVALFVLLAVLSLRQESATFDEAVHIAAGYSYWRTGDFRMNPEHPPLAKLLATLPLLTRTTSFSTDWPEWKGASPWAFGTRFLFAENDHRRLLLASRLVMVAFGALLCALIWAWAHELAGRAGALLALVVAVFLPDFLAHTRLVTTDMPVTTFAFAHAYFLWRTLRRVTLPDALSSGLALAFALASKFSALIFVPVTTALLCWRLLSSTPWHHGGGVVSDAGARRRLLAAVAGLHVLLAAFVLWASYGFQPTEPANVSPGSRPGHPAGAWALAMAPGAYGYGLLDMLDATDRRPVFLDGAHSATGWWSYFVLTFLYKTPLAFLLLLSAAMLWWLLRSGGDRWTLSCLLLPPFFYFAVALAARFNIGHRHLLPVYPFLVVFVACAWARGWSARGRVAALGLVAWQIASVLALHPHHLAYFNEIAGGPRNGWKHLADSNLDWGQDLPGLKLWMDQQGIETVRLSYFGTAPPRSYGIGYQPLPSFMPLPHDAPPGPVLAGDYVAISVTNLQGVYLRDPGFLRFVAGLRRLLPVATIGHSIAIYRIPGPDETAAGIGGARAAPGGANAQAR